MRKTFEYEYWEEKFPLAIVRSERQSFIDKYTKNNTGYFNSVESLDSFIKEQLPQGVTVFGPYDAVIFEQLRKEHGYHTNMPGAIPCDIFIWSIGESEDRTVTKVGGLPYRESSSTWPCGDDGIPYTFEAQITFADSKDILPELPGDILLIFQDDNIKLHFEWINIDEKLKLVQYEDVPNQPERVQPYFGTRYRTYDIPASEQDDLSINVIDGTKVGGIPAWCQDEAQIDGQYLCQLETIYPSWGIPYPLMNCDLLEGSNRDLLFGGIAVMYAFIDGNIINYELHAGD